METFAKERSSLGEQYGRLKADAQSRSDELRALQKQTMDLEREFATFKLQKDAFEAEVKEMRAQECDDAVICVVCLSAEATRVVVPCGHQALCEECCSLPILHCPVCRQFCEMKLRVFRP